LGDWLLGWFELILYPNNLLKDILNNGHIYHHLQQHNRYFKLLFNLANFHHKTISHSFSKPFRKSGKKDSAYSQANAIKSPKCGISELEGTPNV
jgi:hypothetical protein